MTRLVRNVLPERVQHLMWIMELEEGRDVFERFKSRRNANVGGRYYNAGDDVYGIHEMDADYMNIGLAVEIGKEFKYRLLGPISGSDTAGEDEDEIPSRTHVSNVIAFAVTFTRR